MFERNAAIIQSAVRGYQARKKYGVGLLPKINAVDYEAFLVGNDPVLSGLSAYAMQDHFVLVATSCFRAVGMACRLGNQQDKTIIPKIVIIDSSRQVNEVWRLVQNFFVTCHSEEAFQQLFPALIAESAYLFRVVAKIISPHPSIRYPDQDIVKFFQYLFSQYGFDYVRSIIINTAVIQQDWDNTALFVMLKNIFQEIGITQVVAYPSNIVTSYLPQKNAVSIQQILQNIEILQPALTIHTDLCPRHNKPEQAYFFTNNDAAYINQQLFPEGERLRCSVRG